MSATRGGVLEKIDKSSNPFFSTTTSAEVGPNVTAAQEHKYDAPTITSTTAQSASALKFTFATESSRFGEGIGPSQSKMSAALKMPTKRDKARVLRTMQSDTVVDPSGGYTIAKEVASSVPPEVARTAVRCQQISWDPVQQNQLYTTSSFDIGAQVPSATDQNAFRFSRSNHFIDSFPNKGVVPYRDTGLNCATSRSKVHKQLDYRLSGY